MKGKTVVVTGASSGIGLETARELARLGATVVLVCRSEDKARAAMADIVKSTGVAPAQLQLVLADLYSMAEVRKAAAQIKTRCARLDVLVNNAGVILGKKELTVDGFERTFALNHLAYFLMTYELRELLTRSAPARVVSVASQGHTFARLDLQDLNYEKRPYKEIQAYGDSKLCNILFARELARRMAPAGVVSNSMHPGGVATQWGQSGGGLMRTMMKIGKPFLFTPAQGADTVVWLASAPEMADVTGKYWYKRKEKSSTRFAKDDDLAVGLWKQSERMLGITWE